MKRTRRHAVAMMVAASMGMIASGLILARQQRNRIAALRQATARAAASADRTRRDNEELLRGLGEPSAGSPSAAAERQEENPAMERLKLQAARLRHLLAENPEKGIPELALFSEEDWLLLAGSLSLETDADRQKALRSVRSEAKLRLGPLLQDALREYAADPAHDGQLPADVSLLGPYLSSDVPESALARYQMLQTGSLANLAADAVVVAESVPVEERDTRQLVALDGYGQAPINPERYFGLRALAAFERAHPGQRPSSPQDLQPFLEKALEPEALETFYRDWARVPGALGDNLSRWSQRRMTDRPAGTTSSL